MNAITLLLGLLALSYAGSVLRGERAIRGLGLASGAEYVCLGIALASQATTTVYAGRHLHGNAQADWHLAAGNVIAAAAAKGVSLFAQRNGIRAIAEGGPVSIQSHTDALAVLADKAVTVTSSADSVEILAQQNIVLHGGDSLIRLEGNAVTF